MPHSSAPRRSISNSRPQNFSRGLASVATTKPSAENPRGNSDASSRVFFLVAATRHSTRYAGLFGWHQWAKTDRALQPTRCLRSFDSAPVAPKRVGKNMWARRSGFWLEAVTPANATTAFAGDPAPGPPAPQRTTSPGAPAIGPHASKTPQLQPVDQAGDVSRAETIIDIHHRDV